MRWLWGVLLLNAGCGVAAAVGGPCANITDDCTCWSRSDCRVVAETCWCDRQCGGQEACLKCGFSKFIRCEAK